MHRMSLVAAGIFISTWVLFSTPAVAVDTGVDVSKAWSRATAPGQSSAGVWFSITSKQDAKLVAVSSPQAGKAQLHTMSHEQGMMRMRAVESIALPAGKAVELASGGDHVMLLDLKQPLKMGDHLLLSVSVQLANQRQVTQDVVVEVRSLSGERGVHEHHGH